MLRQRNAMPAPTRCHQLETLESRLLLSSTLIPTTVANAPDSGSAVPVGIVHFSDDATSPGIAALINSSTTSAALSIAVPTIISFSASTLNIAYADSAQLTITVTDNNGNPVSNGQVRLRYIPNNATLVTNPLEANGQTQFTIVGAVPGTYQYAADYIPQGIYDASTVSPLTIVVKALPTVDAAVLFNQLLASVTLPSGYPGVTSSASGTVILSDFGTPVASLALSSGSASFDLSGLSTGYHDFTVSYSGDGNYLPAVSSLIHQRLRPPVPTAQKFPLLHLPPMPICP